MDVLEIIDLNNAVHPRRPPKDRTNPLQKWDDVEFFNRYRVTKGGFALLFDVVAPLLTEYTKNTNHPIPKTLQLTTALRYYATGMFQRVSGL